MDDFANILARDYGLKPQGKLSPMSSSTSVKPAPFSAPSNGSTRRSPAPILSDEDPFFGANGARSSSTSGRQNSFSGSDLLGGGYDDVFGGPPKFASSHASASSSYNFEDIFRSASQKPPASAPSNNKASSYPVFDAPVYDDDIFGGLPGIRSADSAYEDVFNIGSTSGPAKSSTSYDDLLGGFGSTEAKDTNTQPTYDPSLAGESAFDDLLPGFGAKEPLQPPEDRKNIPQGDGSAVNLMEDPFTVFQSGPAASTSPNTDNFEAPADGGIRRKDAINGAGPNEDVPGTDFVVPESAKSSSAAESNSTRKSADIPSPSPTQASESMGLNTRAEERVAQERKRTPPDRVTSDESMSTSSAESVSAGSPSRRHTSMKSISADNPAESKQAFREPAVSPSHGRGEADVRSSRFVKDVSMNEFWLSVEEVRLVTQPTEAPPPVRPPPVPGLKQGHVRSSSPTPKFEDESDIGVGMPLESTKGARIEESNAMLDELEEFASGSFRIKSQNAEGAAFPFEEDEGSAAASASGAAMKEAIERAEAKLREAKEAKFRDKEEARAVSGKDVRETQEKEQDKARRDREREERDREARDIRRMEREKEERARQKEQEREERERAKERERELAKEKERERVREKDRADEIARQRAAVDRATAEVRNREAQKAAERAAEARAKAERAAVEKATAEARQRHERVAVERARAAERAAAEAQEKAERERAAAAAAREKVEKGRAAASATAAAAREQQQSNGDDLESFFMSTLRPTSAPKQRTQATSTFPGSQQASEGQWKSSGAASNVKKVPSMPNMVDDLTTLFGGVPSNPGAFQEIEGEPADRRKARWERHQRMLERAAKALEEKHQRDLQSARDQEDRHRVGQIVDAEIKRWAAGKEGNLRALLSTLQYVLWPECGWQAVSLTDLITAAAVKKVYRKATLCVHPDKVQQKGATNQQKYIAEKVFDLLKEAWNKFNSEELF